MRRPYPSIGSRCGLIVGLCFCAAALPAVAQDWRTFQHDSHRTGYTPIFFKPSDIRFAWASPVGFSNPVVVGETVFATGDGSVAAFNLADGTVIWQRAISGSRVAYAGDGLWFTSGNTAYVVDPLTGADRGQAPLQFSKLASPIPLLADDPSGVTFYTSDRDLIAVRRTGDAVNGYQNTVLWNSDPSFFLPTGKMLVQAGESIIVTQPGEYVAIDRHTGAANRFHRSGVTGGGSPPVVFDKDRSQFYVAGRYSSAITGLTAYAYQDNSSISQLWQISGDIRGLALGPDGTIFAAGGSTLYKINPDDGQILDTATGNFAASMTPIIGGDVLIAHSEGPSVAGSINATTFYDIHTLDLLGSLPGTRGGGQTYPFPSIGLLASGHFIQDHGFTEPNPGFKVYVVPEPSITLPILLLSVMLTRRRHVPPYAD